jgi:hypothetical protein
MKRTQVTGLLFLIGGIALTILNWRFALADGKYYLTMSVLAPFAACAGLSVLLYPPPLTESGNVQQRTWKDVPTGQKVLFGVGGVLGLANWGLISGVLSTL